MEAVYSQNLQLIETKNMESKTLHKNFWNKFNFPNCHKIKSVNLNNLSI